MEHACGNLDIVKKNGEKKRLCFLTRYKCLQIQIFIQIKLRKADMFLLSNVDNKTHFQLQPI